MGKSIIMMGATGAVGGKVLEKLVGSDQVSTITLLGRSVVKNLQSDKIIQHSIDVENPETYEQIIHGHDMAICTLGIGEPSKVSKEKFLAIDKMAVIDFATACKKNNIGDFHLLSSVGINKDSRSFYLRSKGELVHELENLLFSRLSVYQPSMIITPTNRYGFSQAMLLKIWPVLSSILVGGMKKYRGIEVQELGHAIANNALKEEHGVERLTWSHFKALQ